MTRALIIEAAGNLWGSERALLDMLKVMPNVEAAVCCPPDTPLGFELSKLKVRLLPYYVSGLHKKSRWHRFRAALGVLRACLEFNPDVIYLNQSGSYRTVLPGATILRLPIVAHVRIFEDAPYLSRQRPSPRRLRSIIAISEAVEHEVRQFRQLDSIPVHRIYDSYGPLSEKQRATSTGRVNKRLTCVGRLVPIKGIDVLIGALNILKLMEPQFECLLIGTGTFEFTEKLKRAVTVNVQNSVKWLGFTPDVLPLLQSCSILVCPSHREPLGRVIYEAWDGGAIPVVFSGSGGAAEIVRAAEGGVLYSDQTPESLARGLHQAMALNQEQRSRLVNNGRSWMAHNCNSTSYGRVISEILENACAS